MKKFYFTSIVSGTVILIGLFILAWLTKSDTLFDLWWVLAIPLVPIIVLSVPLNIYLAIKELRENGIRSIFLISVSLVGLGIIFLITTIDIRWN